MNTEQAKQLDNHDAILLGRNGEPGIAHKVGFMWRVHIWLIGIIGAAAGFSFKWVIDAIGKWGSLHP